LALAPRVSFASSASMTKAIVGAMIRPGGTTMSAVCLEAWWELELLRQRAERAIAESRRLCAESARALDEWHRLRGYPMESRPSNLGQLPGRLGPAAGFVPVNVQQ
jgi:hypothetical protein